MASLLLHFGQSAFVLGSVRIFCSSLPRTIMFSRSCVSRLITLSPRLLVYPHFTHAMYTFFSCLEGRRVVPHLGQNCKNWSARAEAASRIYSLSQSFRKV